MINMGDSVGAVCAQLRAKGIAVPRDNEWLNACVECFESNNPSHSPKELFDFVFEQWTLADLADVGAGTLPPSCKSCNKMILTGKYAVQFNYFIDVSTPAHRQLQKIRRPEVSKNLEVDNERQEKERAQREKVNSARSYKIEITDGVTTVFGFEDSPIPCFGNLIPGEKAVLSGPLEVRKGVLLLKPANVALLGGEVDTLLIKNATENVLARVLNQPENPDPYRIYTPKDPPVGVGALEEVRGEAPSRRDLPRRDEPLRRDPPRQHIVPQDVLDDGEDEALASLAEALENESFPNEDSPLYVSPDPPNRGVLTSLNSNLQQPFSSNRTIPQQTFSSNQTTQEPFSSKRTTPQQPFSSNRTTAQQPFSSDRTTPQQPLSSNLTTREQPFSSNQPPLQQPFSSNQPSPQQSFSSNQPTPRSFNNQNKTKPPTPQSKSSKATSSQSSKSKQPSITSFLSQAKKSPQLPNVSSDLDDGFDDDFEMIAAQTASLAEQQAVESSREDPEKLRKELAASFGARQADASRKESISGISGVSTSSAQEPLSSASRQNKRKDCVELDVFGRPKIPRSDDSSSSEAPAFRNPAHEASRVSSPHVTSSTEEQYDWLPPPPKANLDHVRPSHETGKILVDYTDSSTLDLDLVASQKTASSSKPAAHSRPVLSITNEAFPPKEFPCSRRTTGKVIKVINKLQLRDAKWALSAVVEARGVQLEVDFSPEALDKIFTVTAEEITRQKEQLKTNPALKEKFNGHLRESQKRIQTLNCVMSIHFKNFISKPVVMDVFEDE